MRFRLLGSGVLRPLAHRYLTSVYVQHNDHRYLFDSPENTQVLLQKYNESIKLDAIFLTGVGPATTLGLPGLLTTINHLGRNDPEFREVEVYLPRNAGVENRVERLTSLSMFSPTVHYVTPNQTIIETGDHSILTFETDQNHKGTSLGYRVQESEQPGRFDREQAEELGVPVGPKFGQLHDGESVELEDGRIIHPDDVVGDPRAGRSLVYTGATGLLNEIPEALRDVDVAIFDGGSNDQRSEKFRQKHMTAYDAGTIAGAAGASLLVVTHIRNVFNKSDNPIVHEIVDAFDGPYIVGEDGVAGTIKVKEANETPDNRPQDVLSELEGYSRLANF